MGVAMTADDAVLFADGHAGFRDAPDPRALSEVDGASEALGGLPCKDAAGGSSGEAETEGLSDDDGTGTRGISSRLSG